MKKKCYILILLLFPFTVFAQFAKPVKSLIKAHANFNEDVTRIGIRGAYLNNIHTKSIVFLPAPVMGSEYFNAIPNDMAASLERVVTYLDVSIDMMYGFSTGNYIYNRDKGFQSQEEYGNFVTFWRKEKNSWKILMDFTVDDLKPTTFTPLFSPDKIYIKRFPIIQTSIESTKEIILQSDILYNRALNLKAEYSAWDEYFSDQIRFFRSYTSLQIGKQSLLPKLSKLGYNYEYETSAANTSFSRDLGYTYGYGIVSEWKENRTIDKYVHYLRIWRKEENGVWRIIVDIEKDIKQ